DTGPGQPRTAPLRDHGRRRARRLRGLPEDRHHGRLHPHRDRCPVQGPGHGWDLGPSRPRRRAQAGPQGAAGVLVRRGVDESPPRLPGPQLPRVEQCRDRL
ncbi:MAG: hypothetical protein AVDCRST_MAG60-96, partial [uncultured Nocardioides sp.]